MTPTAPDHGPRQAVPIAGWQKVVTGVLRQMLGADDRDYDDLRQQASESILAAMKQGRFRGDCPFSAWAAVITRNVAVDAVRARCRDRRLFDPGDFHAEDELRAQAQRRARHGAEIYADLMYVDRIISGMGAVSANIICLHDALGYELEEIAAMIGLSVSATQSRLVRARRTIVRKCRPPL